ncbi:MAG: imidazolonepropionase [Candidatus Eremiobacteraeota bacterium]|nr:imidazolonepropionase [Candidatus Eremiobacteraeota bacterium]
MTVRGGAAFHIANATLVSMQPLAARAPQAHVDEADLGVSTQASIVVRAGVVTAMGSLAACKPALAEAANDADFAEYDAAGRVVMPGLVDAHTHALFAGNRVADFEDLSAGRPAGLGMRHTIAQTRVCDQAALERIGAQHLALMLSHGTTTAEVKSGYALTAQGEGRLLEVLAALGRRDGLPHVVPTFCGAHALPPEFASHEAFVDELCDVILPQVARQGIARFGDAFCEHGFFSPAQSQRFLRACGGAGLGTRIHADELQHSGGARVAAALRSASADHCNFIDPDDIAALAAAGCIAVLCPGTVMHLGLDRYAPARELIAAGVPVALASDFNPGTCPSWSLQMMAYLSRRHMRLSAPEAIAAVTVQAARSLRVAKRAGALAVGRSADLVLLVVRDHREFGYYFGSNVVEQVFLAGKACV